LKFSTFIQSEKKMQWHKKLIINNSTIIQLTYKNTELRE